jgi:hypothetical protein
MLDDIVNALHACRWRVHIKAENALTPIEFAALIKFSHRLPSASQLWLEGLASLGNFAAGEPPRFCRQPLAPHIDLYRDPFVPSERKQLIFGLCGAANRLMMPISCALQYWPMLATWCCCATRQSSTISTASRLMPAAWPASRSG